MRPVRLLINGCAGSTVDASDRSVHYGDGVFETLAIDRGEALCIEQHLDRLALGCERLSLPPPDRSALRAEIESIARDQSLAVVKILLSRGVGGRGYLPPEAANPTRAVFLYPWAADTARRREHGIAACLCHGRLAGNPRLAGIKHLNRLEQVLASIEYRERGCDEGLMLNSAGHVVEGTMSNLFLVNDSGLVTPVISDCGVAGIMRQLVIEQVRSQRSIPLRVARVSVQDVMSAREIFVTNSLWGIYPVVSVEHRRIGVGHLARTLQRELIRIGVVAAAG